MNTIARPAALIAASLLLVSCSATPGDAASAHSSAASEKVLPAPEPNPVGSMIWKELPVYEVVQNGADAGQAEALYAALGLHQTASANPVVDYTDAEHYLEIPTLKVTDGNRIAALKADIPGEDDDSIAYTAIDADAVRRIAVYDGNAALKAAAQAAARASLPLGNATPGVGHTVFQATYTDASGASVSLDQPIDTSVSYRFATADGIPFIGPGAVFSITYDGHGAVTQVHYAWRAVKPGVPVKVITEAEARKRIAKTLPAQAKVSLRLVYWCPPFGATLAGGKALEPEVLLPFYAYTAEIPSGSPGTVPGTPLRTRERIIPATDDKRFIPQVDRLDVTGSGTSNVSASIGINGGRPPYTVLWTGSNPEVLANHTHEASYVPLARSGPLPAATAAADETVGSMETISATAVDANGISSIETLTFPVRARPIRTEDHRRHPHGHATFGCESPGEPEEWVQERVGWQVGMANPGAGTQAFCWLGDNSWPGDYIKPSPAGSLPAKPWIHGDADYADWGVNTANLVLINGDGNPDAFTAMFPGAPESDYNNDVILHRPANPSGTVELPTQTYAVNYDGSWGTEGPNDRLYWLAGLLCECLAPADGSGLNTHQRWGAAFGGLHIFTGFSSNAAYSAGAFPKGFAERILGVSGKAQKIKNAWFNASTATNEGTAAAMGPIAAGGVADLDDYYVGQGSMGPSIAPSKIAGWWYLHQ
jgi:hypothetical protein